MNDLRRRLRPCTWIALVALLALALLPTLSRALTLAQGGPSAWTEVCTPQGMTLVAIDGTQGDDGKPVSAAHALEHCPYCPLSAAAAGLPPAPVGMSDPPALADVLPALFLHAPRTLFAWVAAQPRAPPVLS